MYDASNVHDEQFFDVFAKKGIVIPAEVRAKVLAKMWRIRNYVPKVGVLGKTGAGKSSLCNAVFGRDVCPISDVASCTRQLQEVALAVGGNGIRLLDVPGVGESGERDQEYAKLYGELLPELDLILWVVKADDRAFSSDEQFYRQLVRGHVEEGKPFFIVLNQVDKLEPFRQWDEQARQPGPQQARNIEEKRHHLAAFFGLPLTQVVAVSAHEGYGLTQLIDAVIHALPDEKKITVLRQVRREHRSEEAIQEAEEGFVKSAIKFVVDLLPIPQTTKDAIISVSEWKVWPWNWFD